MVERDRDQDIPIVPAAPAVGAPVITPPLLGNEPEDDPVEEVAAEERDRELIEDDSELLDPDSPDFDHSLRSRRDE